VTRSESFFAHRSYWQGSIVLAVNNRVRLQR
jgi:hypothetical protein